MPHLRNDLYCVEWDVKLYYTIPFDAWSLALYPFNALTLLVRRHEGHATQFPSWTGWKSDMWCHFLALIFGLSFSSPAFNFCHPGVNHRHRHCGLIMPLQEKSQSAEYNDYEWYSVQYNAYLCQNHCVTKLFLLNKYPVMQSTAVPPPNHNPNPSLT